MLLIKNGQDPTLGSLRIYDAVLSIDCYYFSLIYAIPALI